MPGVEPGSQAWEACMMPLQYIFAEVSWSNVCLCVRIPKTSCKLLGNDNSKLNRDGIRAGDSSAEISEEWRYTRITPWRKEYSKLLLRASRDASNGVWRNGGASDSRSEGWGCESLCPHSAVNMHLVGQLRLTYC